MNRESQTPARDVLPLPPDLRARLSLAEGENLRILASGTRSIQLERIAPEEAEGMLALPEGRPLVLCAEVRAFSLADVLQLVHVPAKSGLLHFEHAGTEKCVYVHAGEVVFARSNQRVDRLGECLARLGTISREALEQAQRVYEPPTPMGKVLVELGTLTPQQLWEGVKAQVEEIVRSLFAFGAGTVRFFEGEVRPDNVVRLALPTDRLVEEGLAQRGHVLAFLAFLEDPKIKLVAVDGAREPLVGMERAIVEAALSPSPFGVVCRQVGVDPLSGARTVQLLDEMGALRLARRHEGPVERDLRIAADDDLRASVQTYTKLMAELAAPIVAVEGGDGLRDRLSQVAEEASARHPELLAALTFGPGGVVDPELLMRRTLCFPGDRERELRGALGELVAYLEFELLNHPGVHDAASFLEGIDPLRAEL